MQLPTLDKFPRGVLGAIDIQRAFIVSRVIIAAERLQLFRKLHGKRMSAAAIGRALKIHEPYREPFLNSLVSLGLLHKSGDTYRNTCFADKYFITERSIFWTRQYSRECAEAYDTLTVLEQALTSGRSCASIKGLKKPGYVEAMRRDRRRAEDFTQMLFHFHHDDADALAKHLHLSQHRALLDAGGGSGVMSIALARANPHLRACLLDIAPVCRIAAGNIRRAGLSRRINTLSGDLEDKLPTGYDVILFCDIGAVSEQLLQNAYNSLPPGGLIVAVDRYLSDDGTKPLDRLVGSFAGSAVQLATRSDMVARLRSCGFQAVKARKVWRDLWCVTGRKPSSRASHKNNGRFYGITLVATRYR
ncbi:MAG TPA: methyltransferase [Candidatus Eisenbacteria bacterium]|nr:methyltransferase [Candidatus Eisenbacteria bacterium]